MTSEDREVPESTQAVNTTTRVDSPELKWGYDSLWAKAQEFAYRARILSHDAPEFPLWSVFALELLARAALAKIHPSLLADQGDDSILYACGCTDVDNPKSIPVTRVLHRCQAVVPNFTSNHHAIARSLIDRRNEDLHTGGTPFDDLPTEVWLAVECYF